jgi:choice-of-anchor B domain-containing protein
MVKKVFFHFLAVLCSINIYGQKPIENFNIELMSKTPIRSNCNDVWGFLDKNGTEYAVIGSNIGTHVYSLEDPKKPRLRYEALGARSVWRDIKYYKGFLYVTADQDTFGLTIIDVRKAPDTISHSQWKPTLQIGNNTGRLLRAHNLYIDSLGFAYLAGHNLSRRGVMIIDLNKDPLNPEYKSSADRFYSHDAFVQDNKLYSSELNNGFGIYDVRDKSNPIELGRARSSRNFTHNAWLSKDNKYLFTTDEVSGGTVDSYDVQDPSNIRFLDKIKTQPNNTRVIPHNTHVYDQYAVTSWYTDGIVIKDISNPKEMTVVGVYDTYPQDSTLPVSGSLFFGCWGAYPYLPSGLILASDINNGLFVLKPTYQKQSNVMGNIGLIINNVDTIKAPLAEVKYLGSDRSQRIDTLKNSYSFNVSPNKTNRLEFSLPRFNTDTLLFNINQDTSIKINYYFKANKQTLQVKSATNGNFIGNVNYQFSDLASDLPSVKGDNSTSKAEVITQVNKNETLIAGKWGTTFKEISLIQSLNEVLLAPSLEDPMVYNTGWTSTNTSLTGVWEIAIPFGSLDNTSKSVPNNDVKEDLGKGAWITGNSKTNPLNDFVVGGKNTLISPPFTLKNANSVKIKNHLWYFTPLINSMSDSLVITLINSKNEKLVLDKIKNKLADWTKKEYIVESNVILFTDSMRLEYAVTSNDNSFSIEAGVDNLTIEPQSLTNVTAIANEHFQLYPNPTNGIINLDQLNIDFDQIEIFNQNGLFLARLITIFNNIDISNYNTGIYYLHLGHKGKKYISKIIKI